MIETHKLIILIIVILVVGSVIYGIYRVDINKYLRNLPGFYVPEEDEKIDSREDDVVEEDKVKELVQDVSCFKDAFWAKQEGRSFKKILSGEEVIPGDVFIGLEIIDIEKCNNYKIIFDKNVLEGTSNLLLTKSLLQNYKREKDIFYIEYKVMDFGRTKTGEYSFKIIDAFEDKVFQGYKIKVEDPSWFK